jgi:hypothetical protein
MVIVDLTLAVICFSGTCHPALIGKDTPTGVFQLQQRLTDSLGYGGDVLQFKETTTEVFAIHRVWTLSPKEHRVSRLTSGGPEERVITHGCVNVMPAVYEELVSCCSSDILLVR